MALHSVPQDLAKLYRVHMGLVEWYRKQYLASLDHMATKTGTDLYTAITAPDQAKHLLDLATHVKREVEKAEWIKHQMTLLDKAIELSR